MSRESKKIRGSPALYTMFDVPNLVYFCFFKVLSICSAESLFTERNTDCMLILLMSLWTNVLRSRWCLSISTHSLGNFGFGFIMSFLTFKWKSCSEISPGSLALKISSKSLLWTWDMLWPKMPANTSEKQQHLEAVKAKKTERMSVSVTFVLVNICVCLFMQGGHHCLFACHSYESLYASTPELACFPVTVYIWVFRQSSVLQDRSSLKQVLKVISSRDGRTSCVGASSQIPGRQTDGWMVKNIGTSWDFNW